MKASFLIFFTAATMFGSCHVLADNSAQVTEAVNIVERAPQGTSNYTPAKEGTLVHDGEQLKTGDHSRAEMKLVNLTVTRLGANTIYNYSVGSNTIDLQEGDILFCKPKSARQLNIQTAAVTAGITGTTGFVSVQGSGSKKTYILGLIEGSAIVHADGHPFPINGGEILEFKAGSKPFSFAFDLPRFVKSSSFLHKYKSTLPNQSEIDHALAEYADDVSRGFITQPSKGIDYSGQVPVLSTVAYSSAQNANQPKGSAPPPPQPKGSYPFSPGNGSYGH